MNDAEYTTPWHESENRPKDLTDVFAVRENDSPEVRKQKLFFQDAVVLALQAEPGSDRSIGLANILDYGKDELKTKQRKAIYKELRRNVRLMPNHAEGFYGDEEYERLLTHRREVKETLLDGILEFGSEEKAWEAVELFPGELIRNDALIPDRDEEDEVPTDDDDEEVPLTIYGDYDFDDEDLDRLRGERAEEIKAFVECQWVIEIADRYDSERAYERAGQLIERLTPDTPMFYAAVSSLLNVQSEHYRYEEAAANINRFYLDDRDLWREMNTLAEIMHSDKRSNDVRFLAACIRYWPDKIAFLSRQPDFVEAELSITPQKLETPKPVTEVPTKSVTREQLLLEASRKVELAVVGASAPTRPGDIRQRKTRK